MAISLGYNFCSRRFNLDRRRGPTLSTAGETEMNNYMSRLNDLNYNSKHWLYDVAMNILLPLWILFALATLGLIIAYGAVNPEWECYYRRDWWIDYRTNVAYRPEGYNSVEDCLSSRWGIRNRLRTALWVIGFITLGLGLLTLLLTLLFKKFSDLFWHNVTNETYLFANRMAPMGYSVRQYYPGCWGSPSFRATVDTGAPVIVTQTNTYTNPDQVVLNTGGSYFNPDKRAFVTGTATVDPR